MSLPTILFLTILALALVGCASEQVTDSPRTLTILHTNDLHGHLRPWEGWEGDLAGKTVGGADRLAVAVNQIRREAGARNVLLLDAGDAIGDTMIADLTRGRAVLDVMSALRYDAMTIGNHEPDFTAQTLRSHIASARFPIVAANVTDTDTGQLIAQPFILKQVAGVQVGVLGLAYPNTALTTAKKNVQGLRFDPDSVAVVQRFIPRMRQHGARLIIVVSHLGLGADKKLAEQVSGIDVIVSGHSHNRMPRAMSIGPTLIVQAGAHGSDLGRVDLVLDGDKVIDHRRVLLTLDHAHIGSDPAIARLLDAAEAPHRPALDEVIAQASAPIVRAQTLAGQEPRKRDAQSPADSMFADVLREQTGSDLAFLPGVGYGVAIPPGPITAAALRGLIPHHTKVVTLALTGEQVKQVLEQAVENTYSDDPKVKVGGMIQVSGLRFDYDPGRPAGQRILRVLAGDRPLGRDRRYTVATNAMLADGGHNYRTFLVGQDRREHGEQYEMVKSWMRRRGTVSPPTDQRIRALVTD